MRDCTRDAPCRNQERYDPYRKDPYTKERFKGKELKMSLQDRAAKIKQEYEERRSHKKDTQSKQDEMNDVSWHAKKLVHDWLESIHPTVTIYLPKIEKEFSCDLTQLLAVVKNNDESKLLENIEPELWRALGCCTLGHKCMLTKAILQLAWQRPGTCTPLAAKDE